MPNLTLHHSANLAGLAGGRTLRRLNEVAARLFEESDIKTRACAYDRFQVGTSDEARGFAHLVVAMSVRGPAVERELAESLAAVLREGLPPGQGMQVQLCVEIVHVETATYVKHVLS